MFKKLRMGIRKKRNSRKLFWRSFFFGKDLVRKIQYVPINYLTRILSPKIYIASFGGVGSKLLIKTFIKSKDVEELEHFHIHNRTPPNNIKNGIKVIYIFGNPLNSIISFFNRRYYKHSRHHYFSKPGKGHKTSAAIHCKNIGGDWKKLSVEWDLEDYLNNGKDFFKLEEHFNNWINAKVPYPIMLIKFETLWNHLPEIFDFLGFPKSKIKNFPPKQQRTSNWLKEPKHIRKKLYEKYGDFYEKVKKFDEIKIINNDKIENTNKLKPSIFKNP